MKHRARLVLRSVAPFLAALPVLWLVQGALPSYYSFVFINIAVNVILAVSLNVVNGFTGQFSIGHAAFMALVAGMAMASLAGLLVGIPSLRLRGDYLAIVTLGFGEIIRVVIENTRVLGQATGISGLPAYTNVVWAGMGVVATVVMARRLLLSTQGRALLAIREDEIAAEAMGVDTVGWKVRAFVISAAFAGLAGALLVHKIQLVTPRMFTFVKSMEVVVMVVLGGMGSIVAATLLTVALESLQAADQYRMVIFSMLLIVLMLTRPSGLFGTREIWDAMPRWTRRRPDGGAT
jgi:branched-chain amino acid transport system permease protein